MTNTSNSWTVKRLDQVATVTMGQSPPSSSYNTEGTGVPFLQGKPPIVDTMGAAVPKQWTTEPTRVVEAGTALMTVRAPVGEIFTTNDSVCLGRGLAGIKANNDISQEYLNYYLQFAKNQFTSVSQGSTFTAINSGDLKGTEVVLPSIQNQEYFGKVLLAVDQEIAKTYQVIQKTELLKKALFAEIVLKQKNWKKMKLGEIATFKNGINFSKDQKGEDGIPTLDVLNMFTPSIFVDTQNLYRIRVDNGNYKDYLLEQGDILFVRSSVKKEGVGWAALYNRPKEQVLFCGFIIRARFIDDSVAPEFLTHFLRSGMMRQKIIASSGQSAITNISQSSLQNLEVTIPSVTEQNNIVDIMTSFDNKLSSEVAAMNNLKILKKGLMQAIFSRKVEVN